MEKMSMKYWESVEERKIVLNEIKESSDKLAVVRRNDKEHEKHCIIQNGRMRLDNKYARTEKEKEDLETRLLELESRRESIRNDLMVLHKRWLRWYISTQ